MTNYAVIYDIISDVIVQRMEESQENHLAVMHGAIIPMHGAIIPKHGAIHSQAWCNHSHAWCNHSQAWCNHSQFCPFSTFALPAYVI